MTARGALIAAALAAACPHALAQPDREPELTEAEIDALIAEAEVVEVAGPEPLDPAPPGTLDASREELATAAGSSGDVIGAIGNLPGIAQAPAFDGAGHLAIRGTGGEDSLFLIDGIAVPLAMHFESTQTVVPAEVVDSVELIPGGFGVEHGRATGGVVNLRTRPASAERITAFAELSFINAGGMVEGPIARDLSGSISVRRSIVDALLPLLLPDDTPLSFSTPPRYVDAQGRLDWRPGAHHLSLLVLGSDDVMGGDIAAENALDPALTGRFNARDRFWRAIARHQIETATLTSVATAAFGTSLRERVIGQDPGFFYRLAPATVQVREELRWRPLPRLQLRAGGDLERSATQAEGRVVLPPAEGGADPVFSDDTVFELDQRDIEVRAATWLAADVEALSWLQLSPGVRLDRYEGLGATALHPRISARIELPAGVDLRAAAGTYSRPPALAEALADDLDPERAIHAVAGAEVAIASGITAAVTGYSTWLSDLVVGDPRAADPLAAFENIGEGRVIGVEVLVRARRDNLFGWLAYTASRSTRRDGAGMPERLFDHDQTHNLTALASVRLGVWRLGGRLRVATGLPVTPVVGSLYLAESDLYRPIYGPTNSERLALHHQIDLRVDRHFDLGPVAVDAFLDVSNVYANPRQIDRAYNFDYSEREPVTDLPLLPSLGLRGTY